jgi:undecaprenyl diphosphate synthase
MDYNFTKQSTLHAAIIMDGNGRWATARCLPRLLGHRAGIEAAHRIVEAAPDQGIGTLTLFAFSSDNWRRPAEEVGGLMALMEWYLDHETARCRESGVRIEVIGRRDRLDPKLRLAIEVAERGTAAGRRLHLRMAVDYSARDAILAAAGTLADFSREAFDRAIGPPVDLLIRTGGERRLSDFLLWESAYAELVFTRTMWPDFSPAELAAAVQDYRKRERRFGGIPTIPVRRTEAWLD